MDGYQKLALEALRWTYHDLKYGPRGKQRRHYCTARNFINRPLFNLFCAVLNLYPDAVRREMLRRADLYKQEMKKSCPKKTAN